MPKKTEDRGQNMVNVDELRVISDLTFQLVELRQNECKHLAIENIAPKIFHKLLTRMAMFKDGVFCADITTAPCLENHKFNAKLESYGSDEEAAAELDREFQLRWTKVEDDMPDDDIEVLVYCEEQGDTYLAYHDSEKGGWIIPPTGLFYGITHWMEIIPPSTSLTVSTI